MTLLKFDPLQFKKCILIFCAVMMSLSVTGQKQAYQLFDKDGKKVEYDKLLKQSTKSDVVLFGELHNNPICHWLQLELTKDLHAEIGEDLILAAEMFETDNQLLLNEYLGGAISTRNFEDEAKLWNNYKTDYKPLVEFAKANQLSFVASNVPRRYASMIYRGGFESLDQLDDQAKQLIAPLPIPYDSTLKTYVDMLEMSGGHGGANLPKAQAIKDATMAHFIANGLDKGKTVLHFNGTYHSDRFEGIGWYLPKYNKKVKIITIGAVEQDDITVLEDKNKAVADFILVIPNNMTKTY